jgi:hypothetical protein
VRVVDHDGEFVVGLRDHLEAPRDALQRGDAVLDRIEGEPERCCG